MDAIKLHQRGHQSPYLRDFSQPPTIAIRYALRYTIHMIKTWKHKGLRLFFQTGVISGIQAKHQTKLKIILQLLDAAIQPEDLDLPGMRFHGLKGKLNGHYSVTVNSNWRVIFSFEGSDAILVNYLDYH